MSDQSLKQQHQDELRKLENKLGNNINLYYCISNYFNVSFCNNDEELTEKINYLKALNEFKDRDVEENGEIKKGNNLNLLMKNLYCYKKDLNKDFLKFSIDDIKILAQIDLLPDFIKNQDHNIKIDILKFSVELKRADIKITKNLSQIIQALSQENFQYFQSFFQEHQVTFKDLIKIENLGEIFTSKKNFKFNYRKMDGLHENACEWINGMDLIRAFLFFLKENKCFGPLPLYLLKKNNFFMNKDNKEFNDEAFNELIQTFGTERNYYYEQISRFFIDPIAKYQRFYGDLSKMPNALGIIKFLDKKNYNFLCTMRGRPTNLGIIKEAIKKQNYINNKGEEISFFERYKKTLLTSFLLIAIDILILGLAIKFEVFSKIEERMNKFFAISAVVLSAIFIVVIEIFHINKSSKLDLEEFYKLEKELNTQYQDELEKLENKLDYILYSYISDYFKVSSCNNDKELIEKINYLKALNKFKDRDVKENGETKKVNNLNLLLMRNLDRYEKDLNGEFLKFSTYDIKILAQIDLLPDFIKNQNHDRKIDILKFFIKLKRANIEITENLSQIIRALTQKNFEDFQLLFKKNQAAFKDLIKIENLGEIFTSKKSIKFDYPIILREPGGEFEEYITKMNLTEAFLFFLKENKCFGPLPLYLLKKNNFFMNKDNKEFNDEAFNKLIKTFTVERNSCPWIGDRIIDPIAKYQRFYGDLSTMGNAFGIIKFLDEKGFHFDEVIKNSPDNQNIIQEAIKKQNYINNKGEEISFFERYKKTLLTSFLLIAIDILILGFAIKFEVFSKIEEKMNKFFAISAVVLSAIFIVVIEIFHINKSSKLDLEEFYKLEIDEKQAAAK